jgi:ADP-ribose pyrophosphatase YjhB (NUDIX family)
MLTHQIAVNAFLIVDDKFLLIRRTRPPLLWGPPGGHLEKNEDPVSGLKREVYEETRMKIEVFQPVTTWFGSFNSRQLFSIDYLSYTNDRQVQLSEEHSQFAWLSIEDLYKKRSYLLANDKGFKFADFLNAWVVNLCFCERFQQLNDTYKNKIFRKYLPNQR